MSWSGVGTFIGQLFKSKRFWEQTPIVALAFIGVMIVAHYVFHTQPEERRENREAWHKLRADIQEGYERIETKHTDQITQIHGDRREERQELMKLILREKVQGVTSAIRDIAERVATSEGSEASDGTDARLHPDP